MRAAQQRRFIWAKLLPLGRKARGRIGTILDYIQRFDDIELKNDLEKFTKLFRKYGAKTAKELKLAKDKKR